MNWNLLLNIVIAFATSTYAIIAILKYFAKPKLGIKDFSWTLNIDAYTDKDKDRLVEIIVKLKNSGRRELSSCSAYLLIDSGKKGIYPLVYDPNTIFTKEGLRLPKHISVGKVIYKIDIDETKQEINKRATQIEPSIDKGITKLPESVNFNLGIGETKTLYQLIFIPFDVSELTVVATGDGIEKSKTKPFNLKQYLK